MKLLYISPCHGTLEYDELSIFTDLGIEWFSTGLYRDPQNPIVCNAERPSINYIRNEEWNEEFERLNPTYNIYGRVNLDSSFLDKFDLVLVSHLSPYPNHLFDNLDCLKGRVVIVRTHMQQDLRFEYELQQCDKILKTYKVRMSPQERTIPNYAGDDNIIRHCVNATVYQGWVGDDISLLTFSNIFSMRDCHSNGPQYRELKDRLQKIGIKCKLYGWGNDDLEPENKFLSYSEQLEQYRKCRVYFAPGTKPACLTYNFCEALMMGMPVCAWDGKLGNFTERQFSQWSQMYECDKLISNNINGFCSSNVDELEDFVRQCIKYKNLAEEIGKNGRNLALSLFSYSNCLSQWNDVFNELEFTNE